MVTNVLARGQLLISARAASFESHVEDEV